MDFRTVFQRIDPKLRRIAARHDGQGRFIDKDDLYQEMCAHLWNNYKYGVPEKYNDSYILKGCEFHILNYLRKEREGVPLLSLEEPINDEGDTLKDIVPDSGEALGEVINKEVTISDIMNNGFTKREKEVFSLLLKGYTVREIGGKLGVSHVMIVKIKRGLIEKYIGMNKHESNTNRHE